MLSSTTWPLPLGVLWQPASWHLHSTLFCPPRQAIKSLMFRRQVSAIVRARNLRSSFPRPTMELHGLEQKFFLSIPLMCAVRKVSVIWRIVGGWALLSSLISATGRGSSAFSILSSRFAVGGFATRFCMKVLRWFGYEGGPSPRVADLIELVSTFFRHAGLTLNAATDFLKKINEFQAIAPQPHIPPETASPIGTNDSESEEATDTVADNGGQPGGQVKIVSSVIEGKEAISQWKAGNSQISVYVPPDISVETAMELKIHFVQEGAHQLLQGTNINLILQNALVSAKSLLENAKSELENATRRVEELQRVSSSPSDGNTDQ